MSFKIVTDTSCNLPLRFLEPEDIQQVPFFYYPKDNEDDIRQCIDIENFDGKGYYESIKNGLLCNTTQPTPQSYYDVMARHAKAGYDVLYIAMSSGISGAYSTSLIAKEMLEDEFPDRKFFMLDTKSASLAEGIIVLKAIEYRKQGLSIEEAYEKLTYDAKCVYQIFTVDSLRHLQRTGRLSNAAMIIGTVLNIKPILRGNEFGKIINIDKVRGSKKAYQLMADTYDRIVKDAGSQTVCIAHADNESDTAYLSELLNRNNPPKEILSVMYEPVTGTHVGPGTVALFFMGDENCRFQ